MTIRKLMLSLVAALVTLSVWAQAREPLQSLPPEGNEVRGWIGRQIREDAANGWVTTCNRMSHEGILLWDANTLTPVPYYLPWEKGGAKGREAWNKSVPYYQTLIEPMGSYGEGEFEAHWLDMLFRMGWIGNVPEFRELGHQAVKDILESRDPTGYVGVDLPWVRFTGSYTTPFGLKNGDFELYGMSELIYSLLTYYRFNKDEKVLKAVIKAADLTLDHTRGRQFTWVDGFSALGWIELYKVTHRKEYLEMARALTNRLLYMDYLPQLIGREQLRINGHTAATGTLLLQMLGIHQVTGAPDMLDWALKLNERVERYAMQSNGAPTGHSEQFVASSPWANTEGCDITWFGWTWVEMLKATGDAHFADLAEKAALNALPGHRSKDGAVAPYFTRPNQLFATRGSGMGTIYGARVFVDCCHGNLGRLLPVVGENLVLKTPEGDFVIPFYNTSTFRGDSPQAGKVTIVQETEYPFSEQVKITVRLDRPATFVVRLRVPGWCQKAQVKINGNQTLAEAKESWIDLRRRWGGSDVIELTVPMETRVKIDKDGTAVVERGPLVYALPVEGRRVPVDQWGSFEELVTTESKWNYALVLDRANPAKSFTFKEIKVPENAHVWESPRGVLEVEAVRVPEWKFDKDPTLLIPSLTQEVPEPPFPARPIKASGPKETIRLVPYGCTILRMTHLPVADSDN